MSGLTEEEKISWRRFCEFSTWPKIRTTAYEATGELALGPEHGMGVALTVSERGTWCLARKEGEVCAVIWEPIDEEGFVQIAIEPVVLYVKG